ncbi:MAG TPA: LamG-like jellyroll fold domain-containing protein, partial [Verrucomicrobiae bacterium]|nr:LamG-like jellyroll fold domain-containing protein [Verrucomicrobiae bacterium]
PGITYSSSNPGVFSVDTNGVITPGTTPGVATLTVTYQANTLNASVTNLAPTSVTIKAAPGTVYVDGSLGLISAQAAAYANFPGTNNVNISGFASVTFVDQGSPVCSMDTLGVITPTGTQGSAGLGVSYLANAYVTANAFTVTSIANPPVLRHLYTFTNAVNSGIVIDTVGGANGTVFAPLGTNRPITFDGSRVIFPGDGAYTNEPYIGLPAGMLNQMGDVTIELWGGQSQLNTWARFFGFGSTAKGLDPHNYGAETSGLELLSSYGSTGHSTFFTPFHKSDVQASWSLTNGAEYQLVLVYAPNAGTAAFYINGALIGTSTPTNAPLSSSVNDTVDWLGVSLANNDPPLAGWMNSLAIYEGALSASQIYSDYTNGLSLYLPPVTVSTVPTNIVTSVSGGVLTLSWPGDHTGWRLQVQTNSLNSGLGTNWYDVPNATLTNQVSLPISATNGSVFYRMVYP